ncbi:MAG: hypothetical protein HY691_14170, partial [Chloroflexi bacterium]|nr:hypothetical protein [Chloroflexota bacterium]
MLRLRNLALLAALGLIAAVVKQELDKPAAERQWRGTLCGWLPYDFRPPTV